MAYWLALYLNDVYYWVKYVVWIARHGLEQVIETYGEVIWDVLWLCYHCVMLWVGLCYLRICGKVGYVGCVMWNIICDFAQYAVRFDYHLWLEYDV